MMLNALLHIAPPPHVQGGEAVMYKGMLDCFARTVREEGVKALFKVRGGMRWVRGGIRAMCNVGCTTHCEACGR